MTLVYCNTRNPGVEGTGTCSLGFRAQKSLGLLVSNSGLLVSTVLAQESRKAKGAVLHNRLTRLGVLGLRV